MHGTRHYVTRHQLGTLSQEASDPGAVSQETELLVGGDVADKSRRKFKGACAKRLESDAESSSDDSKDSAGPGFHSSSSGESDKEEQR